MDKKIILLNTEYPDSVKTYQQSQWEQPVNFPLQKGEKYTIALIGCTYNPLTEKNKGTTITVRILIHSQLINLATFLANESCIFEPRILAEESINDDVIRTQNINRIKIMFVDCEGNPIESTYCFTACLQITKTPY